MQVFFTIVVFRQRHSSTAGERQVRSHRARCPIWTRTVKDNIFTLQGSSDPRSGTAAQAIMIASVGGRGSCFLQRLLFLVICIYSVNAVAASPRVGVADLRMDRDPDSSSSRATGDVQQPDPVLLEGYAQGCTPPSKLTRYTPSGTAGTCCSTTCGSDTLSKAGQAALRCHIPVGHQQQLQLAAAAIVVCL